MGGARVHLSDSQGLETAAFPGGVGARSQGCLWIGFWGWCLELGDDLVWKRVGVSIGVCGRGIWAEPRESVCSKASDNF